MPRMSINILQLGPTHQMHRQCWARVSWLGHCMPKYIVGSLGYPSKWTIEQEASLIKGWARSKWIGSLDQLCTRFERWKLVDHWSSGQNDDSSLRHHGGIEGEAPQEMVSTLSWVPVFRWRQHFYNLLCVPLYNLLCKLYVKWHVFK